jgi:regulator of protease activity HflC (stomatin/prohibitin superfamily)
MFQNLRVGIKQMEEGWLKNAIIGSVNDVANLYTVEQIFEHRAQFEADIVTECNKRVSKWFNVSQLRTNIVPPDAIVQSINAKTKAVQDVQVAENQRAVAVAEAERKMAEARGDSAQQVIAALAEAKAISVKQDALKQSPQYVELIKAQKWDGRLPQYQLGGGNNGFLFNLNNK